MEKSMANGREWPGCDDPVWLTTADKAEPLEGGWVSVSRMTEGLLRDLSSGSVDLEPVRAFDSAEAAPPRGRGPSRWPVVPGFEILEGRRSRPNVGLPPLSSVLMGNQAAWASVAGRSDGTGRPPSWA